MREGGESLLLFLFMNFWKLEKSHGNLVFGMLLNLSQNIILVELFIYIWTKTVHFFLMDFSWDVHHRYIFKLINLT